MLLRQIRPPPRRMNSGPLSHRGSAAVAMHHSRRTPEVSQSAPEAAQRIERLGDSVRGQQAVVCTPAQSGENLLVKDRRRRARSAPRR